MFQLSFDFWPRIFLLSATIYVSTIFWFLERWPAPNDSYRSSFQLSFDFWSVVVTTPRSWISWFQLSFDFWGVTTQMIQDVVSLLSVSTIFWFLALVCTLRDRYGNVVLVSTIFWFLDISSFLGTPISVPFSCFNYLLISGTSRATSISVDMSSFNYLLISGWYLCVITTARRIA